MIPRRFSKERRESATSYFFEKFFFGHAVRSASCSHNIPSQQRVIYIRSKREARRAADTVPWMAMYYVASERPDNRFEQHRRSCRDVSCGPLDCLKDCFPQKVVSRLDIDGHNTPLVLSFEL